MGLRNIFWNRVTAFITADARRINRVIAYAVKDPYHDITHDGEVYMKRWWLLRERDWFPYAARLHMIKRPDLDRAVHDHPCSFRVLCLMGGYWQQDIYGNTTPMLPGQSAWHPATYFHSIVTMVNPTFGSLSIFIYRHKKKDRNAWGFLVDGKKVPHFAYTTERDRIERERQAEIDRKALRVMSTIADRLTREDLK